MIFIILSGIPFTQAWGQKVENRQDTSSLGLAWDINGTEKNIFYLQRILPKISLEIFGSENMEIEEALKIFLSISRKDSAFGSDKTKGKSSFDSHIPWEKSSLYLTGKPQLESNPNDLVPFDNSYSNALMAAWDHCINAYPALKNNTHYQEFTQLIQNQVLLLYSGRLYGKCHHSYTESEKASFPKNSLLYLNLLKDFTKLEIDGTYSDHFSEMNRKVLLAHLKSRNGGMEFLHYSDFVRNCLVPRWELYRNYVQDCLNNRKKMDTSFINAQMQSLEDKWVMEKPGGKPRVKMETKENILYFYNKYKEIRFFLE